MLKNIALALRNPLNLISLIELVFANIRGAVWSFIIKFPAQNDVGTRMRVFSGFFIRVGSRKCRISIGSDFFARRSCSLIIDGGELTIGNNVFINNYCSISCLRKVEIGSNCLFGEGVLIYDHDHDFSGGGVIKSGGFKCSKVTIGNNVWLASNVVILRGAVIGDNVVVGASTVITGRIPSNSIVVGSGCRELNVRPMVRR